MNKTDKYPLLLSPALKDYIWGGKRLINDFGFVTNTENAAEAWVLSCRNDGENIITNGAFEDKTLSFALNFWDREALGPACDRFSDFPLLIKLIDAKDDLSVQVHPDDEYALANEGEYGKTEMWYVVDCEPDAKLIYGFKRDINKDTFITHLNNNTLCDICNYVSVNKGDVFFIPSGTLHAIGKGMLIAEVQQNSNLTYRVYDYGRTGKDGKPRELHIEKALKVLHLNKPDIPYGNTGECAKHDDYTLRTLACCDKFTADLLNLNGKYLAGLDESFTSLLVINGDVVIKYNDTVINAKKGSSVFLPAGIKVFLDGSAEILISHV